MMTPFFFFCFCLVNFGVTSFAKADAPEAQLIPDSAQLLFEVHDTLNLKVDCRLECRKKELSINSMTISEFSDPSSSKRGEYDQLLRQEHWVSKKNFHIDCVCTVRLSSKILLPYQRLRNTMNDWLAQSIKFYKNFLDLQAEYPTKWKKIFQENGKDQSDSFSSLHTQFRTYFHDLQLKIILFKPKLMQTHFEKKYLQKLAKQIYDIVDSHTHTTLNEKYISFLDFFIKNLYVNLKETNLDKRHFLESFISDMEAYLIEFKRLRNWGQALKPNLQDVINN